MAVRNAIVPMIRVRSVFILIIAYQTCIDDPDVPDGHLLQVFSSPRCQDDICAEYGHSKLTSTCH